MNSRDLTLSAIEGIPEKIPFNPFIMHLAARLMEVDYSQVYCQNAEMLANAQIKCANFFGTHHVNVSTDAYREASAWGVKINFEKHTPVAIKGTTLDWKEFNSVEDPDLSTAPRIENRVEAIRVLKDKAPDQCIIGWIEAPFAELCCIFDMIEILKICLRKDWVEIYQRLLERILPIQLEFAKLQIEAGADIIGAGDSAISQIGPKRYQLGTLEVTKKLFKSIRKYVPVLYHTCGDNSKIDREGNDMLQLIASSGASIVDIDYQVNLTSAKAKIGNNVCIRGNTDTRILGSPLFSIEKIIDTVTENLEHGKPNGKYMYAAGCEWPWEPKETAMRNMIIAKVLTEKLGRYTTGLL